MEKVLDRFEIFKNVEEIANSRAFSDIISRYKDMLASAKEQRTVLYKKPEIKDLENKIITEMLDIRKHDIVEYLSNSGLISVKTSKKILDNFTSHQ